MPPSGLEPPTFWLKAQRASRLHHRGCAGHSVNLARSALSVGMANLGFSQPVNQGYFPII